MLATDTQSAPTASKFASVDAVKEYINYPAFCATVSKSFRLEELGKLRKFPLIVALILPKEKLLKADLVARILKEAEVLCKTAVTSDTQAGLVLHFFQSVSELSQQSGRWPLYNFNPNTPEPAAPPASEVIEIAARGTKRKAPVIATPAPPKRLKVDNSVHLDSLNEILTSDAINEFQNPTTITAFPICLDAGQTNVQFFLPPHAKQRICLRAFFMAPTPQIQWPEELHFHVNDVWIPLTKGADIMELTQWFIPGSVNVLSLCHAQYWSDPIFFFVLQHFEPKDTTGLIPRLPLRPRANGLEFVKKSFKSDLDVQDIHQVVSIVDVIGQTQITLPGRSIHCTHVGVFDLNNWVKTCNTVVKCPLCAKKCRFEDVFIDQYFQDIIAQVKSSGSPATEVCIQPDGTWVPHLPNPQPTRTTKMIESIDLTLSDDDDIVLPPAPTHHATQPPPHFPPQLNYDSDSDVAMN